MSVDNLDYKGMIIRVALGVVEKTSLQINDIIESAGMCLMVPVKNISLTQTTGSSLTASST